MDVVDRQHRFIGRIYEGLLLIEHLSFVFFLFFRYLYLANLSMDIHIPR